MALNEDLKVAIEKNLSSEVGNILKARLEQADRDAKKVGEQRDLIAQLKTLTEDLEKKVRTQEELDKRIETARATEMAARLATADKAIVDLKEKHAQARVDDMKHLVGLVFQNNQFKYQVQDNGYLPVGTGMGGVTTSSHQRTITGQGEGAPPPPPGDVSR